MNNYQKYLEMLNFKEFNVMQKKTFQAYHTGSNLLLNAKTGSGKTYAYLIPLFQELNFLCNKNAIVVVPTNELVTQVAKMAKIIKENTKIILGTAVSSDEEVINYFKTTSNKLLITTPYKLFNYIRLGLKKELFKTIILDEADMMFEGDFLDKTLDLLTLFARQQKVIVSATIKINTLPSLKKIVGAIKEISDRNPFAGQNHYLLMNDYQSRKDVLINLIKSITPYLAIIFTSKIKDLQELSAILVALNKPFINLSSAVNIRNRTKLLTTFDIDKVQYIIASDLYARGIDLPISDVINYDIPTNLDYFIHRSGRCARNNRHGNIYTICSLKQNYQINRLREKGIIFKMLKAKNEELRVMDRKRKSNEHLIAAKQKVKLGKKVKPNYKKNYQRELNKELKKARIKEILKQKRLRKFKEEM